MTDQPERTRQVLVALIHQATRHDHSADQLAESILRAGFIRPDPEAQRAIREGLTRLANARRTQR
jgi:hypothetical protein